MTIEAYIVEAILPDGYYQSGQFAPTREGLTMANELCLKWRLERMMRTGHTNAIGFRVLRIRERIETS